MQLSTIRPGALFMQLSILLMAFLLLIVLFFSKATSFLLFNYYHSTMLDNFFTYYTYLGDGIVAVLIIGVLLLCGKKVLSTRLFFSFVVSGITSQILKNIFHTPRPKSFFIHQSYHYFIEGITHSGFHSFPSGHTTTAFAMATTLACHFRQKILCFVFLVLAAGVGYSRIYLGQHFVEDVFAGMVLGISTATLIEYLHHNVKIPKFKSDPAIIQHE